MNSLKKSTGIDFVKFLMALVVVGIHTHPFVNINNDIFLNIWSVITKTAVPFFFIASGYFLFSKVYRDYDANYQKEQIKLYIVRIVRLYIYWTLIYLPITIWYYSKHIGASYNIIVDFIKKFFLVGGYYFSGPLWYLLSMIYALAIILILFYYRIKLKELLLISLFLFLISIFINFIIQNKFENIYITKISIFFKEQFGSGRLFSGMLYLIIGAFLSKLNKKIPFPIIILISLGVITIQIYYVKILSEFLFIFLPSLLFIISLQLNIIDESQGYFLRKSSTVIYFSHMIIVFSYTLLFKNFPYFGPDIFLISIIIPLLFTSVIIKYENRLLILKKLF